MDPMVAQHGGRLTFQNPEPTDKGFVQNIDKVLACCNDHFVKSLGKAAWGEGAEILAIWQ
jgi:hypothetical protein